MDEKIIGYILLAAGVITIVFSIFSVYGVFTGQEKPATLFTSGGINIDMSGLVGQEMALEQKQALQESGALETEIIESTVMNTALNSVFHLLLMGFVASAGFKIARVGATLARPVKINIKEKSE